VSSWVSTAIRFEKIDRSSDKLIMWSSGVLLDTAATNAVLERGSRIQSNQEKALAAILYVKESACASFPRIPEYR
jgi:hypothetical protein